MKNRTVNALLKENRKALQFLHSAYGFDFEAPFFIKRIEGRFTYNTVTKSIGEKLDGKYKAVMLIKPEQRWKDSFERLHVVDVKLGKFERPDRQSAKMWRFNIDEFYSVGDFEETRKNKTKFAYIIAQNNEHRKLPAEKTIDGNTRYKLYDNRYNHGVYRSGDGRGNSYISKLVLTSPDGSRENLEYCPFNSFYWGEKEKLGDDINNYIDKSGYLIRIKRHDLKRRAIALKTERDLNAVKTTDYSNRLHDIEAKKQRAKLYISDLAIKAETKEDGNRLNKAANYLAQALDRLDRFPAIEFKSVTQKDEFLDKTEILLNAVLLVEED